jgi:hypothetical protein
LTRRTTCGARGLNALWVSDLAYVAAWSGFAYVAFIIDTYARRIVGWRVSRTAHAGFVLDALEQALHERRPPHRGGLVHHSDRGSGYLSIRYGERLAQVGIEPSISSLGVFTKPGQLQKSTGRSRSTLLRGTGAPAPGSVNQASRPSASTARFNPLKQFRSSG